MGIPKVYSAGAGADAVASFDYTDIFQGIAYEDYHGGAAGSAKYFLSSAVFYSCPLITSAAYSSEYPTWDKKIDKDFDITFELPRIIDGICVCNIPVSSVETGGLNGYHKVEVIVIKYDGTNPETLVTLTGDETAEENKTTGSSTQSMTFALMGDIPRTKFKTGDILRFSVQVFTTSRSAGNTTEGTVYLAHDPKERASTLFPTTGQTSTKMLFRVPVRIDL